MDERLEPIKDLELVITDDMKEILFDIMVISQMLKDSSLSKRERKTLENHKQDLVDDFKSQLQTYNPTEVAIVRAFLSGKKNEER